MPPIVDKKKCIGCMTCAAICPADVYGLQEKGARFPQIRFPDECWHCNACVRDCPAKAISLRLPMPMNMVFVEAPPVHLPEGAEAASAFGTKSK